MKRRKLANEELNRISPEEFKKSAKTPIVVILDDVRSLHNVGSVFRTADAFLIEKIYLCGITAKPPHREIRKTALGATESVNWEYRKEILPLIKELKATHNVVAIEQTENSTSLNDYEAKLEKPTAMVFGNEVKGVKQEVVDISDTVLEIPQLGTKHSLNISVSAGIVIWHFFTAIFTRKML